MSKREHTKRRRRNSASDRGGKRREITTWSMKEGSDWYLRAYIDKPDGVNIGDCEAVSRARPTNWMKPILSRTPIFEVSSPGWAGR
ncbi:MAG: hypothetical protein ACLURV_13805 [Gallintestinimicrobium sp.]